MKQMKTVAAFFNLNTQQRSQDNPNTSKLDQIGFTVQFAPTIWFSGLSHFFNGEKGWDSTAYIFSGLYFVYNLFEYTLQITVTTSVYHRYFELFGSDKHYIVSPGMLHTVNKMHGI